MPRLFRILVLFITGFLVQYPSFIKAQQGGGYAQLAASYIKYDRLHHNHGPPINLPRTVTDITMEGYFEYQLTDRLSTIVRVPFKIVQTGNNLHSDHDFNTPVESGSLSHFGNIALAGQYWITSLRSVNLYGYMGVLMPTSARQTKTGLQTDYRAWGGEPSILAEKGWEKGYVSLKMGSVLRNNNYSTAFVGRLEGGVNLWNQIQLIGTVRLLRSLYDGSRSDQKFEQTGLYVNNQEYLAFTAKLNIPLTDRWGVLGMTSGGIFANQVPQGLLTMGGIYYRWGNK